MDEVTAFVLYFLAFALIHSVLATDNAKERAEKILKSNFRFYILPEWIFPFLTLLQLLAIGLFGYALFQNDLLEFAGLKKKKIDSKPITDGVYRIVRHPQYTALIILIFSQNKMTVLDLTAAVLISSFGDRYRKNQEQVSMFIPVKWILKRI